MKIIQLLPTLEIGGLERIAVDLAIRQKVEGHQPSLYCTRHAGPLAVEAAAYGVPVLEFGKMDGFSPRLVYRLAARLRQDKPDVLHAHNALVLHYGIAAARLAGVPVVVNTRHGGNLRWDPRCERLWSRMVPWADQVIFVSESVRAHFVARTGISKRNTGVIYNGIDVEKFSRRAARRTSNGPRFCFGTVGRLRPAKDHVTLTRAFARVAKIWPAAELHILGEGPCRAAITETAVSLGITDHVKLHGASLDVPGFLAGLDLFVLSSLDEGLPIAIQEAMAAGLPIVSTRLPGLIEIAPEGEVAWYCPPGNPEKLADLMLQVAHCTDLCSIGEAARQLAQKFGIDETWRQYRDLFEELLSTNRRSRIAS